MKCAVSVKYTPDFDKSFKKRECKISDYVEILKINIYTLLYIKLIINKDLLYSTGNSTQYSVITSMGKEPKKEWIYVYV